MRLPLNATKNLLSATTEKLKESSREYQIGAQVWGPAMQAMLSNVLQMTRHATSFPNSSNWSNFPPELQMVMQKMLVDRFWQAGISNESRDEFYARIAESGDTYEGFASAIRGIPRQIRDWCYHIVYGMTRFEEEFFGLKELPRPLAEALLTDASYLSTHHLQRLIALVERLVQRCPAHHRRHFMPPILALFFSQTDKKISAEWEVIERSSTQSVEGEDQLNDEMKAESVLRATTYAVVNFASSILDQRATGAFLISNTFLKYAELIFPYRRHTIHPTPTLPTHNAHSSPLRSLDSRTLDPLLHPRPPHARLTLLHPDLPHPSLHPTNLCRRLTSSTTSP